VAQDSKDLLERALAGDQTAWEELIKQCYNIMRGVTRKYKLFDLVPKDPEDLVHQSPTHDVLVKVLPRLNKLETKSRPAFLNYVKTAAESWAIDELRRRGRWKFAEPGSNDEENALTIELPDDSPEANPQETASNREMLEHLRNCKSELSEENKEILRLHLEEEQLEEIGEKMDLSASAVWKRLVQVRRQLRKCLEKQRKDDVGKRLAG